MESGGRKAAYAADLMPTAAHVGEGWNMAYDRYPVDTIAAKEAFVQDAIARETLVFLDHDPVVAAGLIRQENGKRRLSGADKQI
jgi:hypothetical protein